jgi:hypothetical protein
VNAIITKTLVATKQVELSEEELEARGIHRQLGLNESDVEYLDAEIERVGGIKEAFSSSSSSSSSSESSYLPIKVVRPQEREI